MSKQMRSKKQSRKTSNKPFALNIGRVRAKKYGFVKEHFDDMPSLLARAAQIAGKESHASGLRELQIAVHKGPVA